jgi:hypothetical protein
LGFSSFHEFSEFIIRNRFEGSQFTGQGRGVKGRGDGMEMEWSGVEWCGVVSLRVMYW